MLRHVQVPFGWLLAWAPACSEVRQDAPDSTAAPEAPRVSWGAIQLQVALEGGTEEVDSEWGEIVLGTADGPMNLSMCCDYPWFACLDALPEPGEWRDDAPTPGQFAQLGSVEPIVVETGWGWYGAGPGPLRDGCVIGDMEDGGPSVSFKYLEVFHSLYDGIFTDATEKNGPYVEDMGYPERSEPLVLGWSEANGDGKEISIPGGVLVPPGSSEISIEIESAGVEDSSYCGLDYFAGCTLLAGTGSDVRIRWTPPVYVADGEESRVYLNVANYGAAGYWWETNHERPTRVGAFGLSDTGTALIPVKDLLPVRPFEELLLGVFRARHDVELVGGVALERFSSVESSWAFLRFIDLAGYMTLPANTVAEDCASAVGLDTVGVGDWTGSLLGRTGEHQVGESDGGGDVAVALDVTTPVKVTFTLPFEVATLSAWDPSCGSPFGDVVEARGAVETTLTVPGRWILVLDAEFGGDGQPALYRPPGEPFALSVEKL